MSGISDNSARISNEAVRGIESKALSSKEVLSTASEVLKIAKDNQIKAAHLSVTHAGDQPNEMAKNFGAIGSQASLLFNIFLKVGKSGKAAINAVYGQGKVLINPKAAESINNASAVQMAEIFKRSLAEAKLPEESSPPF